jgi:hypothetical protein
MMKYLSSKYLKAAPEPIKLALEWTPDCLKNEQFVAENPGIESVMVRVTASRYGIMNRGFCGADFGGCLRVHESIESSDRKCAVSDRFRCDAVEFHS